MRRFVRRFALFCAAAAMSACAWGTGRTPSGPAPAPSATPFPRATPYAELPAAGICAEPEGEEVVMRLEPGLPDPRCMVVRADQRLRVVNRTGADVEISLGRFTLPLPMNGETVIGPSFGDYLEPGVHVVAVDPCCGGELWLRVGPE